MKLTPAILQKSYLVPFSPQRNLEVIELLLHEDLMSQERVPLKLAIIKKRAFEQVIAP